jgi:hypothetical protein
VAAAGAAVVVVANLPGWNLHVVPVGVRTALHVRQNRDESFFRSEFEQWQRQVDSARQWTLRGRALKVVSEPGDSMVMSAIGAAGFYSDLFVFDRHGFVNTEVSTREREAVAADELKSPGHDDPVEDSFFLELGYEPTFLYGRMRFARGDKAAVKQVDQQRKRLKKRDLDGQYAAEAWPVVGEEVAGYAQTPYLVVWRRIPEAGSAAEAWARYERMVEGIARGRPIEVIDLDRGQIVSTEN